MVVACRDTVEKPVVLQKFDRTENLHRKHKYYYSSFNFILEPSGKLFYHKKDSLMNCCDTGMDLNYPDYVGLTPKDLVECSNRDFSRIVDSAKNFTTTDKNSIQIAVYNDTVNVKRIQQLLSIMNDKSFSNFDIRKVTEEEQVVLTTKLNKKPYDFYNIRWKSRFSNMLFPPRPVNPGANAKY
jgi:hypothetical protein